jgi:hypothetical protein
MGLLDRFRLRTLAAGDQSGIANGQPPPYGRTPTPLDTMTGITSPEPDPGTVRPRVGVPPIGASGRANFYGLPQPDETNAQLIGPQGLRNFDLMYRTDPHIRRLVLMAWAPIVGGNWTLEPYGGDQASDLDREVAESIWWGLTSFMSPNWWEHLNVCGPVLLRSGFAPFEEIWATTSHKGKPLTLPRKLDLRLPRSIWRWWQDDYGELTHLGQILPNKPDVIIPASEIVYYRLAPEGDNWVGTSLLRHAYKPWVAKDRLERIAIIGEERKAVGVPFVYPPENADDQTRSDLETVFAHLHTNEVSYVIMPGPHAQDVKDSSGVQGWRTEVVTFDSSSGTSIQDLLGYWKQSIESSFAQDFMALGQHQVGARATAEVQEDPYLASVNALAVASVIPPLQNLIARIAELNWGEKIEGPPKLSLALHESASLSEVAGYLQQLVAAEVITPDEELEDWSREHADLPPANRDIRALKTQAQKEGLQRAAQPSEPIDPNAKPDSPQPSEPIDPNAKPDSAQPPPASGAQKPQPKQTLDAEPTVKWWEQLLSQDKLNEAFDGARQHVENAAKPAALLAARQLAVQAVNGSELQSAPPEDLVNALATHLADMHRLGMNTVHAEIAKQRQAMQLDAIPYPTPGDGNALQRAQRAARTILEQVIRRLEQWLLNHRADGPQMQQVAEMAAIGALHEIALDYTAAQINDGRAQGAQAEDGVVGGYYTAVLDKNTCSECASQDTGTLMTLSQAIEATPNPYCAGGDRCRCTVVYVMADDPAAVAAALS